MAVPRPSAGQDVLDDLKALSLGFARTCNYSLYLEQAKFVSKNWSLLTDLDNFRQLFKANPRGMPVFDLLGGMLDRSAENQLRRSAEIQAEGLLYQLEQVCQMAMQAEQANRFYSIYRSGQFNVGRMIDWLADEMTIDVRVLALPDSNITTDEWTAITNRTPLFATAIDSIYEDIAQSAARSLRSVDEVLKSMNAIADEIANLKNQLWLRAELDPETGNWTCPEGYPDPNVPQDRAAMKRDPDGFLICGPVGPERSQQLLAHTEILKTEMMAIRQVLDARFLELNAIRLMSENQKGRIDNFHSHIVQTNR